LMETFDNLRQIRPARGKLLQLSLAALALVEMLGQLLLLRVGGHAAEQLAKLIGRWTARFHVRPPPAGASPRLPPSDAPARGSWRRRSPRETSQSPWRLPAPRSLRPP